MQSLLPRLAASLAALLLTTTAGASHGTAPVELGARMAGIDIGAHVEILEDPSKTLSVEDVRTSAVAASFQPAPERGVNLGFRDGAIWVRIRLVPGEGRGPWFLDVGYPLLDHVELHVPGRSQPFVAGDQVHAAEKVHPDRHLVFPIERGSEEAYLLRVVNGGAMNVPLRLWDADSFHESRRDSSFVLGGYFGLIAAMMLYNLVLFAILRDRAYAAYCLYVLGIATVIGADNGFTGLYLWPDSPVFANWVQLASAPFVCAMASWFTREYLSTQRNAPVVDRVLFGIVCVGLVDMATTVFYPRVLTFWFGHTLALATLSVMTVAGVGAWRRGFRPARYYTIAFAALIAGGMLMVLRNFSLLPANLLTDHGIQIGSALDTLLLSMGLAARINELRSAASRAQREAFESQSTLVEALRKTERELEGRVAQRTSELEDMNRQMHHQAQHDALTGLPNRYLLRDRLEQATARAKRDRGAFAVLMIDLDNFKSINDTLGHDVGDLLLVEVSRRLATCMRERDTIARLGGDEFVAVLEELVAAEDSAIVAGKIVEALAAPVSIGGELLRTSPSIGISLYPEDAQDADFLMKFADIAMYRAKAAGRNCHRFYRDPPPLHAYEDARTT